MSAADDTGDEYFNTILFAVDTPSGAQLNLMTELERDWYVSRRDRYLQDNKLTNVSDLQDLDRLLVLEVMVYRWSLWLGQGFDYQFARIDEATIQSNIKSYSIELRQLKSNLGIDKVTREKDKGANVAEYIDNLLRRAREFGYHRNDQYATAVTKIYHLRSMVLTYDRCDDEERRTLDLSPDSILAWIREDLIADWDKLSEDFRKNQSMWVRDL